VSPPEFDVSPWLVYLAAFDVLLSAPDVETAHVAESLMFAECRERLKVPSTNHEESR